MVKLFQFTVKKVFRLSKLYVSDCTPGRSSNRILKLSRCVDEALESKWNASDNGLKISIWFV